MRNKRRKETRIIDKFIAMLIVLAAWKLLTFIFSPLVVPTIGSVVLELVEIFTTASLYKMIGITIVRLMVGLSIGIIIGLIIGIIMGHFKRIKGIIIPIIGIMQTVPPVAWVVLALVWFGFNGKPAIFIVIISSIPIISIQVCEGIERIDQRLIQMAYVYQFSKKKKLLHIVLPSIAPNFKTSFQVALGSGWKIAVMGEVLTTSDGIGGMIKLARLNIEPENIIAWSIIIVMLFYLSDLLIYKIFFRRERNYADC